MRNCKNCFSTNDNFGITFDNSNICSSCSNFFLRNNESSKDIWKNLYQKLLIFFEKKGTHYDCLVPIRGDAEDFFVIQFLIEHNLNPLILAVNNYFNNDIYWSNFHNLITYYDIDSISINPNIDIYKRMVKESFTKFDDIYLPYKLILWNSAYELAESKKIPLIILGQCQPIEFSGKFRFYDELKLSNWYLREHEFGNISSSAFCKTETLLSEKDILSYVEPNEKLLKKIPAIFLSNYIKWDQLTQNISISNSNVGYRPSHNANTYDVCENNGSYIYYHLHDLLRYKKFNKPKVKNHLERDFRFDKIKKDQYFSIINNIDDYLCYDIENFFTNFLDISLSGYEWIVENKFLKYKNIIKSKYINGPKKKFNVRTFEKLKIYKSIQEIVLYDKGISI